MSLALFHCFSFLRQFYSCSVPRKATKSFTERTDFYAESNWFFHFKKFVKFLVVRFWISQNVDARRTKCGVHMFLLNIKSWRILIFLKILSSTRIQNWFLGLLITLPKLIARKFFIYYFFLNTNRYFSWFCYKEVY